MKPLSILIVDDEEANCENLSDILEIEGHSVCWTVSPNEALELAESSPLAPFDIALIDLKMPEMSGPQLLTRLLQTSPATQAILITAYADTSNFDEEATRSFEVVLTKPIDVEMLLGCIQNLVPIVLLVDDDHEFCDSLSEVLESHGIRTNFSHDLESAAQSLEEDDYDLAIYDLRLPDGSGLEAAGQTRLRHPQMGTILITGFPNDYKQLSQADTDQAINAFFEKPIDPQNLLKTIFEITKQKDSGNKIESSDR